MEKKCQGSKDGHVTSKKRSQLADQIEDSGADAEKVSWRKKISFASWPSKAQSLPTSVAPSFSEFAALKVAGKEVPKAKATVKRKAEAQEEGLEAPLEAPEAPEAVVFKVLAAPKLQMGLKIGASYSEAALREKCAGDEVPSSLLKRI